MKERSVRIVPFNMFPANIIFSRSCRSPNLVGLVPLILLFDRSITINSPKFTILVGIVLVSLLLGMFLRQAWNESLLLRVIKLHFSILFSLSLSLSQFIWNTIYVSLSPITLSFQNHCSLQYHKVMAKKS